MSQPESDDSDPEIDRINLRISRSFLDVVDETWRERGFNSRSEFIRYALRDSVNHPEGAGFWKDLAISEAQFSEEEAVSSAEIKSKYGTDDEGRRVEMGVVAASGNPVVATAVRHPTADYRQTRRGGLLGVA